MLNSMLTTNRRNKMWKQMMQLLGMKKRNRGNGVLFSLLAVGASTAAFMMMRRGNLGNIGNIGNKLNIQNAINSLGMNKNHFQPRPQ
jgi:hypothetical protein